MGTIDQDLKTFIRDVPDFPRRGILFRDITPLLQDAGAFAQAVRQLTPVSGDRGITKVAAIEARGFLLGGAVANQLGVGLVPIRKRGKLPGATRQATYQLEYGTDVLEIHADAVRAGEGVLLVDDLLATGGTLRAAAQLIEGLGARVKEIRCLIELTDLRGRDRLQGYSVFSLIQY